MKIKKPIYLSNSAVNTYLDCGEKYRLSYIERIRINYTKSSFTFGSAIDNAVEVMLQNIGKPKSKQKDPHKKFKSTLTKYNINGKLTTLPKTSNCKYSKADVQMELLDEANLKDISDYMVSLGYDMSDYTVSDFWTHYDTSTKLKETLTKDDFLVFAYLAYNCLLKKGEMLLPVLQQWVDDNVVEVHSTQQELRIEDEEGNVLRGFMDFVVTLKNGKKVLLDLKTSSNPNVDYPDGCVEDSQQLSIYYQEVTVDEAGYLVIGKNIRKKKEPRVALREVYGVIPEENIDKVFDNIHGVLDNIKQEKFEKNKSSCWNWGGCEYKDLCHKGSMKGLVKLKDK